MQIQTQQPVEISEEQARIFAASPEFAAQQKLDGERCVLTIKGGVVTARNRVGRELDVQGMKATRDCVFDGEVVDGVFIAFDILELDGVNLRILPFGGRFNFLLKKAPTPFTPAFVGHAKTKLIDLANKKGWEGLVFKRLDGEYRVQENTPVTFKFKFKQTASFIVSAVRENSVSLSMVDFPDNGKCGVPFAEACGIQPGNIIEVQYLYAHTSGKLCQPIYKGIRNDVPKERCVFSQLRLKVSNGDAQIS